ncbi:hypothetical protein [Actinoplanes sp. NPDC005259]|uniref:hypothetical protein n=1 Tax=Actinoplanes sp. NPDC005259 TaxID=3154674 RepID=UPI0033A29D66
MQGGRTDGLGVRPAPGATPEAEGRANPSRARDLVRRAREGNIRDAEQRTLDALTVNQREALRAAFAEAQVVADRELLRMRELVASLHSDNGPHRPEVVDEGYRVKTLESLARKFQEREALRAVSVTEFLETANDRVRFSIALPERGYGRTVEDALGWLRRNGYEVLEVASFWGNGKGRHNGLNVTLRNEDGFRMELQFPTRKSREVGKETHYLYEIVRLQTNEVSGPDRIEAFFAILALNKFAEMARHLPDGLDLIHGLTEVDTSFRRWITPKRMPWLEYLDTLEERDTTLVRELETWALDVSDVPGLEGLDTGP